LGWELQRTICTLGEMTCLDFPKVDLADAAGLRSVIRRANPDLIVNAAACTNVDKAESEPDLAMTVNALAPAIMAEEARRLKAALIHYSTDYVFDGQKGEDYAESDQPHPLNVYGSSKLEGERRVLAAGGACLIFRTSWVYSLRSGGFVTRVLQWARQQQTLRIVEDQISSPTWARMLAETTSQVIAQGRKDPIGFLSERAGLYHLAGAGSTSRYEWAIQILQLDPHPEQQIVREVHPAKTSEFPTPATRPMQTGLSVQKFETTFGLKIPAWQESLRLLMS
jgi:dTDP-4-dehydrorhamnose reductase